MARNPGAANLIALVRDFDGTVTRLKAAGGKVISAGGVPATIGNGLKVVSMQDPDGIVLELNGAPEAPARHAAGNVRVRRSFSSMCGIWMDW